MTTPPIIYRVTKDDASHLHQGEFKTRAQAEKALAKLPADQGYEIIETRGREPRELQAPTETQTKENE